MSLRAFMLMWSVSTIMPRRIIDRMTSSPSGVSPLGLQSGAGGYTGSCPCSSGCVSAGPEQRVDQLGVLGGRVGGLVVVVRVVAVIRGPELARGVLVAGVDEHPGRPRVEFHAAERVVELVDREERPNADRLQLIELVLDLLRSALRDVLELPAIEDLGLLDTEDHRQLAHR